MASTARQARNLPTLRLDVIRSMLNCDIFYMSVVPGMCSICCDRIVPELLVINAIALICSSSIDSKDG